MLTRTGSRTLRVIRRDKGAFSLLVDEESQPRDKSRDYAPERSIALSAAAILQLGLDGPLAQDLGLAVRRELEGLRYLGPLRRKPERDYVWNKSSPGDIGNDGAVTDRADRKMVAAVLEAQQQGHSCHLVNACDTDWLDCEAALNSAGIEVQHLLREWILAAHANKHRK